MPSSMSQHLVPGRKVGAARHLEGSSTVAPLVIEAEFRVAAPEVLRVRLLYIPCYVKSSADGSIVGDSGRNSML